MSILRIKPKSNSDFMSCLKINDNLLCHTIHCLEWKHIDEKTILTCNQNMYNKSYTRNAKITKLTCNMYESRLLLYQLEQKFTCNLYLMKNEDFKDYVHKKVVFERFKCSIG